MARLSEQLDQKDISRFIREHYEHEGERVGEVYFALGEDDPRPLDPEVELTATVVFK